MAGSLVRQMRKSSACLAEKHQRGALAYLQGMADSFGEIKASRCSMWGAVINLVVIVDGRQCFCGCKKLACLYSQAIYASIYIARMLSIYFSLLIQGENLVIITVFLDFARSQQDRSGRDMPRFPIKVCKIRRPALARKIIIVGASS